MAITRVDLQTALIGPDGCCTNWWDAIGRSTTYATDNPSLNQVLANGCRDAGVALASPFNVTNDDLAAVPDADAAKVFDIVRLRMLETILGNWTKTNSTINMKSVNFSDIMKAITEQIKELRPVIKAKYGITVGAGPRSMPTLVGPMNYTHPRPGLTANPFPDPPTNPWGLGNGRTDH